MPDYAKLEAIVSRLRFLVQEGATARVTIIFNDGGIVKATKEAEL